MNLYNDKGNKISGIKRLSKPEYADENGDPNWKKYLKYADENGFYILHKYPDGGYTRKTVLSVGTILIRYGNIFGRFVADDGTPYEALSLPYEKDTVEFHRYKVIAPFEVIEGKIAPGFDTPDEPNKATQYLSENRISKLLNVVIEEVFLNE